MYKIFCIVSYKYTVLLDPLSVGETITNIPTSRNPPLPAKKSGTPITMQPTHTHEHTHLTNKAKINQCIPKSKHVIQRKTDLQTCKQSSRTELKKIYICESDWNKNIPKKNWRKSGSTFNTMITIHMLIIEIINWSQSFLYYWDLHKWWCN